MSKRTTDKSKLTYEQAIEQLEALLEKLDTGEIGLEESLRHYERGVELIKHCRGVLGRVEKRIHELKLTDAGEIEDDG
jgi:exodeoxyribonuclease VII small subunit